MELVNIDHGKEGGFRMEIQWPIFLKDQNGWMNAFNNSCDLKNHIESIDVEAKEYQGWDNQGHKIELFLEDNEIKIKIFSTTEYLNELIESIKKYVELERPKDKFIYMGNPENISQLFNAVNEHIKKTSLLCKLKNKLIGFFRGKSWIKINGLRPR